VSRFFLLMSWAALAPLLVSAPAMAQAKPKPAAAAKSTYPLLPAGAGRDVEIRVCSQCHTPERPATERHDPAGWNDIINQMGLSRQIFSARQASPARPQEVAPLPP
jgi:cytochrome c5